MTTASNANRSRLVPAVGANEEYIPNASPGERHRGEGDRRRDAEDVPVVGAGELGRLAIDRDRADQPAGARP